MSQTLQELAIAQDTLNSAIKDLVDGFITDTGAHVQSASINCYLETENQTVIQVSTSIEATVDGARITRSIQQ